MKEDIFQKRINETEWDIFPVERLLELETVYAIFEREYNQQEDKSIFFKKRRYQRLREGYFCMFVATFLFKTTSNNHYIVFPKDPKNDSYITYLENIEAKPRPKFIGYEFDVKEFTEYEPSFENFFQEKILPKLEIYNMIIPTYKDINWNDITCLVDYLKISNSDRKVWILGFPAKGDQDWNISGVTLITKGGIDVNDTIDLREWLDKTKPASIFQDKINFK